jgi:uncharacterized membrane protein YhdT
MTINRSIFSRNTVKIVLLIWMVFVLLAAFFIPQYDMGFDGVKLWFLFSGLILLVLFAAAFSLSLMKA